MSTVSDIEEFLRSHPGVPFSPKNLTNKKMASSERAVNIAMKGAITRKATQVVMDEKGRFMWPSEPFDSLGGGIPPSDEDILIPDEIIDGIATPMPGTQYDDQLVVKGNFMGDPIVYDARTGNYHVMHLIPFKHVLDITAPIDTSTI